MNENISLSNKNRDGSDFSLSSVQDRRASFFFHDFITSLLYVLVRPRHASFIDDKEFLPPLASSH